jgi:3-keto-disaccharide hydrolase
MKKNIYDFMNLSGILLMLLLITNCGESKINVENPDGHNTLTKVEIADGWQLLFDGKSFDGWRGIGIEDVPEGHWKIENGVIQKIASGNVPSKADGQPVKGGDLITKETYQDYELKFDWKISEGGNSGVKYNVDEEISIENGWTGALGYEYQVLDDDKHSDNVTPSHRSGSLYDMIESKGKVLKPVGEFNTARIVFNKGILEHWLNGEKVVSFDTTTPEFDLIFQKSKYNTHPDFTVHKKAHIVLQDHHDDCWYRNIKIKVLK